MHVTNFNFRGINLRQIRYFVVLAEVLNYRRAAEQLRMSQPPLTQQIQRLERFLGAKLLKRSAVNLQLTDAGQEFYVHCRTLLNGLVEACERARAIGSGAIGDVGIGIVDDFSYGPIVSALTTYNATHVGARTRVITEWSDSLVERVLTGQLDAAVINLPSGPDLSPLLLFNLPPSRIMAVTTDAHPLAARASISVAELLQYPVVMPPVVPSSPFSRQCIRMFTASQLTPRFAHFATTVVMIQTLLAGTESVGLVSEYAFQEQAGFTRIPIDDTLAVLSHAVAVSPRRLRAVEPFLKLLDLNVPNSRTGDELEKAKA